MKWLRSNIRHGSRLALVALALQFAFSFGHFHAFAAQAAPAIESIQQQPASNHDSDGQSHDTCAICAVIALANTVLFATPPLLPPPQAVESHYQITDTGFVDPNAARVAFQPRAPPLT